MSDRPAQARWRVLVTPRWIGWHLLALALVIGMLWLGDWQLRRALGGNVLSWAYTFEWPVFAIFGVVFWAKTVKDELRPAEQAGQQPEQVSLPAGALRRGEAGAADEDQAGAARQPAGPADIELAEYNAYLAKLSEQAKGHGRR